MTTPTLDLRALNRATLARQHLLQRSAMNALAMIEHLVGLQAQMPQSWYVGLWSRVANLDPVAVGALLENRSAVRIPVMRSTVHVMTAEDALGLRPLTQTPIERSTLGVFGRYLTGIDNAELAAAARESVSEKSLPAAELGRALLAKFPDRNSDALAQAARMWLPMVQVPPRGVWGRSGRPLQAPLDTWVGRPMAAFSLEHLIERYLAAFGPATVRDVQQWCGLTKLAEVVERMRDRLLVFTGPGGVELFDLPDAPRPDPGTPAPIRFLYDYDNLLLSHADRSRIVGPPGAVDYVAQGFSAESGVQPSSMLADGFVAATWKVQKVGKLATLTVTGFREFTARERDEIHSEATDLLAFLHPRASHDVILHAELKPSDSMMSTRIPVSDPDS